MINIRNIIDALKYGRTYTPTNNISLNDDIIEVLEDVEGCSTVEDMKITASEIFSQLPNEDHMAEIQEVVLKAKSLKKSEMVVELNRIYNMMEEMNQSFCDAQGYAASLLKEND